jgi:hypothetical protein
MSTEQKHTEQNALAARLSNFWGDFKQGKIIGYKLMAVILILGATIGSTLYIVSERRTANSHQWVMLDEANTANSLLEISKNNPNTIQDRLARVQIARNELGVGGIDRLGSIDTVQRKKAVENIEKAREAFEKLLDEFKNDPVFKVECLLALAKAEAALVAVPVKDGQLTEFKGTIPKVVEWLDQLSTAAAPDTPWATDSKKLADSLRDPNSSTAHEFFRVQQALFRPLFGDPGAGTDPLTPPTSPFQSGPGGFPKLPYIKGVPEPISPPGKGPDIKAPEGPIVPLPPGPKGTDPVAPKDPNAPIAPPPKAADPKAPQTPPITPPVAPEPKAPAKSPEVPPKAPDPKATDPKAPEPKPPIAPPEKKPG